MVLDLTDSQSQELKLLAVSGLSLQACWVSAAGPTPAGDAFLDAVTELGEFTTWPEIIEALDCLAVVRAES